jgi:hypothetical protein
MRNSSSLDWLRFMHTPNDYRVSQETTKQAKTKQLINYYYEKHFIYTFCYSDLN